MREIQELVLARAYEERSLDSAFEERRKRLPKVDIIPTVSPLQLIRVTLLPVGARLFLDRIYQREEVRPLDQSWTARLGEDPIRLELPDFGPVRRPILRGVLYESADESLRVVQEIGCNGLVEFVLRETITSAEQDRVIPEWVLALTINALFTADCFRRAAGAPDVEYALELEILKTWEAPRLNRFRGQVTPNSTVGELHPNPLLLPRFSVGPVVEFPRILQVIYQDLFNAAGRIGDRELTVDLSGLIP